jgi:16S rRNA (cytosine1402-N4)-methyltransferase
MGEPSHNPSDPPPDGRRPPRRQRYRGTHPVRFHEKYKEHSPEAYPGIHEHVLAQGRTPAGAHVPIMVAEVLAALALQPGDVVADATLGHGGHAAAMLRNILPGGRLVGFDVDAAELDRTASRLRAEFPGAAMTFHRGNFAGLDQPLRTAGLAGYDAVLADLGVSSMQIDNPDRGFSYKHDGPLDMRMDVRLKRTAADLLATMDEGELAAALKDLGDEPDHGRIARAVADARIRRPLRTTGELADLVLATKGLTRAAWARRDESRRGETHPAARTFQALRMLVNDELGTLRQMLRTVPWCLRPGGRLAILTFHRGEEEVVRAALTEARAAGQYEATSQEPTRPSKEELRANPRCQSARLHWARCAREGT